MRKPLSFDEVQLRNFIRGVTGVTTLWSRTLDDGSVLKMSRYLDARDGHRFYKIEILEENREMERGSRGMDFILARELYGGINSLSDYKEAVK